MASLPGSPDIAEESEGSISSPAPIPFSARPNKWTGPSSTWRKLTEQERLVSTSMDRLRDRDLAVHLYNAHAMKRRHYDPNAVPNIKPWTSKERWRKAGDTDNQEDIIPPFVPPKSWTAWPLNADDVPRSGEQVDEDDLYTLKRREVERPSRELEDILTGVTLRFAKEHFKARKWESPFDNDNLGDGSMTDKRSKESTEGNSTEDAQLSDQTDPQDKMHFDENSDDQNASDNDIDFAAGEVRSETEEIRAGGGNILKEAPEVPLDKVPRTLRPTVSVDDERSRKILRPTIRHTLSRLDELLMALHHSRQACLRFRSEQVGSQTEAETENENRDEAEATNLQPHPISSTVSSPPRSRSRGRPPKTPAIQDASEDVLDDPLEPRRRSNRGRKRKVHTPLEGESKYEMAARIARLQHRAIPCPSATTPKPPPVKQRKRSRTPGNKSEALLGLRDWSEVLGVAAMIGFSPEIIMSATQRCANIFGEGMDMRFLVESALPGEDDKLKRYAPEQIPAIDDQNIRKSDNRNSSIRASSSRIRRPSCPDPEVGESEDDKLSITSGITVLKGEFFCPHAQCVRHEQGFNRKGHFRSHLKSVHKQTGDKADQFMKGSDEEMEGAVHVDRFLKHTRRRVGWRGTDGAPRKRKRKRKNVKASDKLRAQTDEVSDNEKSLDRTQEEGESNSSSEAPKSESDN